MTNRVESVLSAQLERMERARDARESRPAMKDAQVTLSHGSGGKAMHQLIAAVFLPAFDNPALDGVSDSAVVHVNGKVNARLAFTTDTYVVHPLFFPGGDIGRLAVHGTINDLAMSGARPLCLSVGLVLEEGLSMDVLRRVIESMAAAAKEAGVAIVTGDTKVVPRGKADQLFINTSGIGVLERDADETPAAARARPGDVVLLSGFVADHGMAVMLAREALDIEAEIRSDSAALHELVEGLLNAAPGTRVLKDPTRGGVAAALNEVAKASEVGIQVEEERIPVRPEVRAACEMLGIDPLHIANEGKLLAIVAPGEAEAAVAALRAHPLGADARRIGVVAEEPKGMVVLRTPVGGSRVLDMLVGDPLPRIC